jgi:hypothetical protein
MRIYIFADQTEENLPLEEVWLEEDDVLSNIQYCKKWDKEHGLPDRYENTRNYRPYECFPGTKNQYTRVLLDRQYLLKYYEVVSVEEFLVAHPDREVTYTSGHFFLKTWVD